MRIRRITLALTALLTLIVATMQPLAAAPSRLDCLGPSPVEAASLEPVLKLNGCELEGVVIRDHGVGAAIPDEGVTVEARAETPIGERVFRLAHEKGGVIRLSYVGDELANEKTSLGEGDLGITAAAACSDPLYNVFPAMERDTRIWYFNRSTTPSNLTQTNAENAIRAGASNITNANNDCGKPDNVSATHSYAGNTTARANISDVGDCTSRDGNNVVDFDIMPDPSIGVACMWWFPIPLAHDEMMEGDISFYSSSGFWTTGVGTCSFQYDLESTSTHEHGHVYGLNHVSESENGNLTMSPVINGACQTSERTLGLGDILGLEHFYKAF